MIQKLVDVIFADLMEDFILIEEIVYIPFDSLGHCVILLVMFTVGCWYIGVALAEILGFLLRRIFVWIQARKGGT